MDYSYILKSYRVKKDSLLDFGFEKKSEMQFIYKRDLAENDFSAEFSMNLKDSVFEVHVFDKLTGDRYALFEMKNSKGAFVGTLRQEVDNIIEEICSKCFDCEDFHEKYVFWMEKRFNCKADFPWGELPFACVFRCPNQKWFALVMKIKYKQLGLLSDEETYVVNLKAPVEMIKNNEANFIDGKSVFPAYHMNKKHWITVLLTSVTDFEKLCLLTDQSYKLVNKK